MARVSPARAAAFQILIELERGRAHADDLLRGNSVSSLAERDRNLTTALVLGVLRWQIRLDSQIHKFLSRPDARLEAEVQIALRLGAFQLTHMDRIPARAAIDESVELTKQSGHRFAAGMVNAVLRKLAATANDKLPEDTVKDLALAQAHPLWMVERWANVYGLDATRAICRHGQSQAAATLRIAGESVVNELARAEIKLESGELLAAARRLTAGNVTATAAFHEGRVRLQDEGSQLVAEIAGRGAVILDCCAAPGGKTMILAERNLSARIVACESSEQRLAQLRERLATHGDRFEFLLSDAASLSDANAYDLVLADVPCSGTGTLGRNLEIRHRLRLEDLARQAERQRAILQAALRAASLGGHVVYSTCSLEPEENEHVIAAVLADVRGVRIVPLGNRIAEMLQEGILTDSGAEKLQHCISPEGFLQLLPGEFSSDGFFICLFEKLTTLR